MLGSSSGQPRRRLPRAAANREPFAIARLTLRHSHRDERPPGGLRRNVATTGNGANGIFAYGSGTAITVSGTSVNAAGQYAHGIMASGG
ncbi:MAG: hypothetical protein WCI74_09065 [Actinomycetes bacterium]